MRNFLTLLILMSTLALTAQRRPNAEPEWTATWITLGDSDAEAAGMYLFRKSFNLDAAPTSFPIRISADNRYKLFVNGNLVSVGPNWGDIKHWNYQSMDIASNLKQGQNTIAVKVWNEADLRAVAQFSFKTALILQGQTEQAKIVDTNKSWKVTEDKSYTPLKQYIRGYYAAGAGDFIDMNKAVGNWNAQNFDDSSWDAADTVFEAVQQGFGFRQQEGWNLVPSILPEMELTNERLATVRKAEGVKVPSSFPAKPTDIKIDANSNIKILLDQEHLTNAYLSLLFSGGKNSVITVQYAEGLYDSEGAKGNRNDIEGKTMTGRRDSIISNGKANQEYTSLTYRTYRYVELGVETKDEPLVINDIYGTFTGYPFQMKANLFSESEELSEMMEIGWRTARLCAVDTYMDCPYYERLQYVGDTRIQHFVSFYNSGDDRLIKNAINLIDYSRQPNGHTLSRYPDRQDQVIPTYSLWYVSMLYDYMMYGSDADFVAEKLMGSRQVLNYFITYLDDDGSLKNVPGWNYTDWVPEWNFGMAPMAEDGSSAALDLQMLHALQSGIALEEELGKPEFVTLYKTMADQLTETIKSKYWDESKQLFADTPAKDKFSQHANTLAILANIVDEDTKKAIGKSLLEDKTLAPTSIYFSYYLHLALNEAGYGDQYLEWLDVWRKNMELGLTTWGETSQVETTRSDCHAWGSSPNIEFFRILLGIESASPNFKTVRIAPNLGDIKKIGGEMPHPAGMISVDYKMSGKKLQATINLPSGVDGEFVWNGQVNALSAGENKINL
ncbi:alpha-L-rhamnosidase-related protein [Flagellimonas zhangzhouensis]|uniref:Alpha-L-rhamnosidase N-terminal domain-containing protein n=1 Tax=Flagellimonas zhangzhouensis TaxID=1073328 RepID=A0A1H2YNY9_9FLAO|nr:alpha-L-rhamnosidase N-terminal domain-containing protein [Allomuricauda zhangzhouensis]SDR01556.1 Alpha-L-rhamnosidase N-terminal domain-containing protein [Allomuricauda zhangzhouensis]SDX06354.1 Alpha-L-rhamnosidase N-terminal domain-containing protein [Allomuricauda zhangzhouensis]